MHEAVKAGRTLEKIFIQKGKKGGQLQELIYDARERNIPVTFEDKKIISLIAGSAVHQGVIGFAGKKDYSSIEHLLDELDEIENPVVLLLDEVNDPRNVGAIIRTAVAAGINGMILPARRNSSLNSTVAKTAAGALEHLTISKVPNIARAIELLKERHFWVYGLDGTADRAYTSVDYKGSVALIVGNEDKGIRRLTSEYCDDLVSIPLLGNAESLNVSVAFGVVAYEVVRQRMGVGT